MNSNHDYCLILAGGNGTRLWPVSRSTRPKQFLDLLGTGRTLLQETYDRVAQFMPRERIFVSTNVEYLPLVYEQLPQVDDTHILEEPLRRGTLAAVAWGTVVIAKIDPKANVFVTPADQLILKEDVYRNDISVAFDFIRTHQGLLVVGVQPSRAESGYGYIQMDDKRGNECDIYPVKSFTEKPNPEFAEMFLREGDFLWNTGLIFFQVDVMLRTLYDFVPEYQVEIPRMMAEAESADPRLVPEFFSSLPNLNIDVSIMERSENVYVKKGHFTWADIGTWACMFADLDKDGEGNVMLNSKAYLYGCKNNLIRLPQGRTAVIKGLEDFVVVEEGEILMICPRTDVAAMRRMHTDTKFS